MDFVGATIQLFDDPVLCSISKCKLDSGNALLNFSEHILSTAVRMYGKPNGHAQSRGSLCRTPTKFGSWTPQGPETL